MRKILLFAMLLSGWSGAQGSTIEARDTSPSHRDSVYRQVIEQGALTLSCHFTYDQNSSEINPALANNRQELDKLNEFICTAVSDPKLYVSSVKLTGYSSIEGAYAVNERLARNRVQAFKGYLENEYALSERLPVEVSWVAEDWGSLYNTIQASDLPERAEILHIIETYDVFRGRENHLMRVGGGKVYKEMLNTYFPALRRVEIRVEYDLQRLLADVYNRPINEGEMEQVLQNERAKLREEIYWEVREELPRIDTLVTYQDGPSKGKIEVLGLGEIYSITHTAEDPLCSLCFPKWGVKTNLMHLAGFADGIEYTTPLLNLSVEYFFTRHFSLELGGSYSNWKYDKGKEFQGITGVRLEPRYWLLHSKSFTCVYVGAYGQLGDYNKRTLITDSNNETYNQTGNYYEAGLSAGCYIPLSLNWGLDIGLRGGYQHTKGKVYERAEGSPNEIVYDRSSNRLRLNAIVLGFTYRWGHK